MGDIDLAELRKNCLNNLYSCIDDIYKYNASEKEIELDKLRNCVKQYCKLEYQHNSAMAVLAAEEESDQDTLDESFHNIEIPNISETHPYLVEFERHIQAIEQRSRGNPDQQEDSDLVITETQDSNIDPLNKQPIKCPVKNRHCGHIYEKSVIEEFIKHKNKGCPCEYEENMYWRSWMFQYPKHDS